MKKVGVREIEKEKRFQNASAVLPYVFSQENFKHFTLVEKTVA